MTETGHIGGILACSHKEDVGSLTMSHLPTLLTVRDAARLVQVDPATIWRWVSSGRFGPKLLRIGRARRIRAAEFNAWVATGCPPCARWEWDEHRSNAL